MQTLSSPRSQTPSRLARLLAAALLAAVAASAQTNPTLRTLAHTRGIVVGAAVTFPSGNSAENRPEYERVLKSEFNGMVAENAMKHQNLTSGGRNVYNWGPADAIAEFAAANNMKLRGHTLVWHSQTATWFNNLTGAQASRDTTLKIMKDHIDSVAGRYKGKIYEWDVVNEAIGQNGAPSPNYRSEAASRWYNRVGGIDYIDSAFVWAHKVDPAAKLFYNDFGGEFMNDANANSKSKNIYDLVKGLKERGAPIHGVGLQCHFNVGQIDTATMGANMRRIAALGLDISLTEIDIQIASSGTPTTTQLETQKENYKAVAALCLSVPRCKSFFVWGLNDNQSWRRPQASTAPLLFTGTSTITPKPAYFGTAEAITAAPIVVALAPGGPAIPARKVRLDATRNGIVRVPGADGIVRDLQGRSLPARGAPADIRP
jgi:endo-1,4-beta-xylanase